MIMKLKFSDRVFLGESLKGDPSGVIKKLKRNKPVLGSYILCPAGNGIDPIEYFDSKQLLQPCYKDRELLILGIAGSEEEAIGLVREIYEASVEYGHDSIRSYVEGLFS